MTIQLDLDRIKEARKELDGACSLPLGIFKARSRQMIVPNN